MLLLKKEYVDLMIKHAINDDPNECCGILAGNGNEVSLVYKIRNTTPSPYRYVMDPQEMLNAMQDADQKGLDFIAFYHSHTHSPAYPSDTDTRMAVESGWVDFRYGLVSLEDKTTPCVKFFTIDADGKVSDVEFRIL